MCDTVSAITTGLKIATAVQDYRSQRAVAKSQEIANTQTRKNSDQAYLNDISKIDREAVSTTREKIAEEFRLTQESNKKQAQALNLNAGNGIKIIQDIAGTYDNEFLMVTRDFETDVLKLQSQEAEAYAAQQRRYNSIAPVVMPNRTGLLLQVATAGAEGYQMHKSLTAPNTSPVNTVGKNKFTQYGYK